MFLVWGDIKGSASPTTPVVSVLLGDMLKFNKSNASLFAARGKGGGFLSTTAFFIRLENEPHLLLQV